MPCDILDITEISVLNITSLHAICSVVINTATATRYICVCEHIYLLLFYVFLGIKSMYFQKSNSMYVYRLFQYLSYLPYQYQVSLCDLMINK